MIVRRILPILLVLVLASGCSSIPDDGPVHSVSDSSVERGTTVRFAPAGPADGAAPDAIVDGFIEAMLAFPVSHRVASSFLSEGVNWASGQSTSIYSGRPTVSAPTIGPAGATVTVTFDQVAQLDAQGRYTPQARTVSIDIALTQNRSATKEVQWRIASPPVGTWVSQSWFGDYMRPGNLYFLNASGTRVVAVPVWQPAGDSLATALVTALAAGPLPTDGAGLTTAVPTPEDLHGSVPIDGQGLAQIELSIPASDLSRTRQEQLLAQFAWTLRDTPGVTGLQVTAGGANLNPRGQGTQLTQWADFGGTRQRDLTVLGANRLSLVRSGRIAAMAGQWGQDARGATAAVVAGALVVARLANGDVVVTRRNGSMVRTLGARSAGVPVVDTDGRTWITDHPRGATVRVRVVDPVGGVRGINTRALTASGDVSAVVPSPDLATYAAVADGHLLVGDLIETAGEGLVLGAPTRLHTAVGGIVSLDWYADSVVTVVGRLSGQGGTDRLFSVRCDDSETLDSVPSSTALLADTTATVVRTIEGSVYALGADHRLWALRGPGWERVGDGSIDSIS